MTRNEIDGLIVLVEGMFNRRYTDQSKKMLSEFLASEPSSAAVKATKRLESLEVQMMPDPRMLVKLIREAAAEGRERSASEDKRKMTRAVENVFTDGNCQLAKNTTTLVVALVSGKIDKRKYLDGIRHLHGIAPAAGFAKSGMFLARQWNMEA